MKVSVALCTYNGQEYIEEQIHSILNQSVPVDEIIICDDGSTDKTVDIVNSILRESAVSYRVEANKDSFGVAKNFLKALKMTSGEYVFTCDQDDVWHTDKVKIFLDEAMKTQKDLYFSNGNLVDEKGAFLGTNLWEAYSIDYSRILQTPLINTILKSPIVTGAAMMITRRLIDTVDTIPHDFLHDEWFSIVAAISNSAQPINEITFDYRQHGKNVVGAKKQTLMKKVQTWLSNYKNIGAIHKKYYGKSCDISSLANNTEHEEITHEYRSFWEDLFHISQMGRWKGAFVVTKHFFCGRYFKFYTGLRGYVRDLICVLFF